MTESANGTREQDALAKIKAVEASTKAAIRQRRPEVPLVSQFTMGQLGLSQVVADEWGTLWRVERDRLVRLGSLRKGLFGDV